MEQPTAMVTVSCKVCYWFLWSDFDNLHILLSWHIGSYYLLEDSASNIYCHPPSRVCPVTLIYTYILENSRQLLLQTSDCNSTCNFFSPLLTDYRNRDVLDWTFIYIDHMFVLVETNYCMFIFRLFLKFTNIYWLDIGWQAGAELGIFACSGGHVIVFGSSSYSFNSKQIDTAILSSSWI